MRCKNCGWENPANNANCEKCNAPLDGSMGQEENNPSAKYVPQKTAKGCPTCGYPIREVEKSCPHCGHVFVGERQESPTEKEALPPKKQQPEPKQTPEIPKPAPVIPIPVEKTCVYCKATVPETAHYCSNCGASLTNVRKTLEGTIKPWVRAEKIPIPECSLTPVSGDDEPISESMLRFSGDVIQLNRSNTEPSNQTITSKTQAELSFENGKWYIQDKSALKTTYIYAGYKTELKPDDIIVLGNRLFKFGNLADNQPVQP